MVAIWQMGLTGIVLVAMATDLKRRKIYNWLTFPAMLVGLILQGVFGGISGVQSGLIGLLVGSVIFLIGFVVGAMGAGDVKLMAAVGAWLGWPHAVAAVLYVSCFGGLIAIVAAVMHGSLWRMLANVYWFMVGLVLPGGKAQAAFAQSAAPPVPYGVSIALGTILALFYPEPIHLLAALGVGS